MHVRKGTLLPFSLNLRALAPPFRCPWTQMKQTRPLLSQLMRIQIADITWPCHVNSTEGGEWGERISFWFTSFLIVP